MKLLQQLCRARNSSPTEPSFFRALDSSSSDELYGLPSLLDDSLVVCRVAGRFVVKRLPRQSSGTQQEISRSATVFPPPHCHSSHQFPRHWTIEEALQKIRDLSTSESPGEETETALTRVNRSRQLSEDSNHSVWCSQCLDDERILLCCFCGCKVCYGKHDSQSLLRCEGCEDEYHVACLRPALERVPDGVWFCSFCLANPQLQRSTLQELDRQKHAHGVTASTASSSDGGDPSQQPARRGRGRPPGSSRRAQHSPSDEKETPSESNKAATKLKQLFAPQVSFANSTSEIPTPLSPGLSSSSLPETPLKGGHALEIAESETSKSAASGNPSKRRVPVPAVQSTNQPPAIAPMNLENAIQSLQCLLDRGASKAQLSLRETARLDVATMQYNAFKEWAPTPELKVLLEELLECRNDLLER
jgi:hypothetical protein